MSVARTCGVDELLRLLLGVLVFQNVLYAAAEHSDPRIVVDFQRYVFTVGFHVGNRTENAADGDDPVILL